MTSSTTIFNNHSHSISSLPSPPISHHYYHYLNSSDNNIENKPTFTVDRSPPLIYTTTYNKTRVGDRSGMLSDTRYTSHHSYLNRRHRELDELRPFLFNPVSDNNSNKVYLPPIQNLTSPTSSPSPPFESSYYAASSTSTISSIASSPTPVDEEDDLYNNLDQQQQQKQQQPMINVRRKGSIASLLNSLPELKQLDEEESKCNYLSHFMNSTVSIKTSNHYQQSLKRGRPRQDHIEFPTIIKKQRKTSSSHNLDCVQQQPQACQSTTSSQVIPAAIGAQTTTTNDSPRATKGLRHFSKQVCDKVAKKGVTSYNEVADELALDIQNAALANEKQTYDQKNIRRRVYDALNVLMAMNIIAKDKKVIKWLGIPDCYKQGSTQDDDLFSIKEETNDENKLDDVSRQFLLKQIEQEELRQTKLVKSLDLLRKDVNTKRAKRLQLCSLVWRNQQKQKRHDDDNKIQLPFFIVACPITVKDEHLQVIHQSRSAAVISIQRHDQQPDSRMIYEDGFVLQHLKLS